MKHVVFLSFSAFAVLAAMSLVPGCSSDDTPAAPPPDNDAGGGDGSVAIRDFGIPNVPCDDSVDSIYGDPGPLPPGKGVIVKCHEDPTLSKDALQSRLDQLGYKGKSLTSGARVMRVSFTTERGDDKNTRAISSALVYVPTTPRANDLPIITGARGTRGQGPDCAASKKKEGLGVNEDLDRLGYGIVGHGYAIIIPDLPGYANFGAAGNPPSSYNDARDVGKATLDATRALKQLFKFNLSDKTVIVGHSQGGHSALAALSLVDTYGVEGTVVGTAVYAPLWVTQRSWGALLSPAIAMQLGYDIKSHPDANAVSIWYHYTHAELHDGPGEGVKLFKPEFRDGIKKFVEEQCYDPPYPALEAMGTWLYELFDPPMLNVGTAAAGLGACDAADTLCQKWIARYQADRPHITSNTPILMLYGGNDQTIPSDRLKCAYDTLVSDGTNLSLCYETAPGGADYNSHQGILNEKMDYVADWIGNLALGAPAPAACGGGAEAVEGLTCATPPPND